MNLLVYQLLFSITSKKLPIKRTVKKWFTFEFATCFLFPYKIFSRGLHSWKNHWSWFGPVCWADKWSVWCCKQGAIHRTGRSTVTIASVAVSFISRKVVVFLSFCNPIPLYDLNNYYCYVPLNVDLFGYQAIASIAESWEQITLDIGPYKDRGHFRLKYEHFTLQKL